MPEPVAPQDVYPEGPAGLEQQLMEEDQASIEAADKSKATDGGETGKNASEAPAEEKKEGGDPGKESGDEDEPEEGAESDEPDESEEDEEGKEKSPDEEEDEEEDGEEDDPDKSKSKKSKSKEPQEGSLKIGKREFASTDEALKEATRIMGHNARIAGELKTKSEQLSTIEAEKQQLEADLEKHKEANAKWAKWYKSRGTRGNEKPPVEEATPESIAEQTAKIIEKREAEKREAEAQKASIEALEALENFPDVAELVASLDGKENPLTGKNFTPEEAYDYAVSYKGLDNLRKTAKKKAKEEPAEPAQKRNRKRVKSAAARPSGGGSPSAPKSNEPDLVDSMLNEKAGLNFS